MYFLIASLILFFGFIIYFYLVVKKFISESKKSNMIILTDKVYVYLLIITAFLSIAIIIATIIKDYETIINSNQFPYICLCISLIISTYKMFLSEGLYAFNDDSVIGYNLKLNIKDLKIKQVKSTPFERVKVVAMFNNQKTKKQEKLILRLSKNNFDKLKAII